MDNNEQIVETETTTTENVEKTVEKTFTQKEFDEALQKAILRRTKNLPNDEELKSFNEWKKNNQSDSEKIKTLEDSNISKDNLIKDLKAQICISKSDVKPEFIEFVTSKVVSMSDENTTFEEALKEFKKNSPQYFGEVQVKKVQSSPVLNGGHQPQTTNDIMNNLLRGRGE